MKLYNNPLKIIGSAFLVCLALSVLAHDAWVEPTAGPIYRILYGHKIPEPYKPVKVTSIKVFDANKKPLKFNKIETKEGLSIKTSKGTPAMFALEYDNGYWVTVGGETKNVRKSQMPEGTNPSHPLKFSKTIKSWQSWMKKPLGQRIEFVPVEFSEAPKAGFQLKLQLLLEGKPLSGQMVENNSNEEGPKTDENGYVMVTVLKGKNRFATDHDIKQPNEPDAQRLSLTAALVFMAR
jgi:nickel transport protein